MLVDLGNSLPEGQLLRRQRAAERLPPQPGVTCLAFDSTRLSASDVGFPIKVRPARDPEESADPLSLPHSGGV